MGGQVMLRYNEWDKPEGGEIQKLYYAPWNDKDEALIGDAGHGGGDFGIMQDFLHILRNGGESRSCAEVSLQSHLICFAAEKSRKEKIVVELS